MNEFNRRTSGVNRKCFDKHIATIEKSGRDISNLMDWIEATDFLSAPASQKYHANYGGGLLEHSLNVAQLLSTLTEQNKLVWATETSPLFVGLFHDVCKIGCYEMEYRNKKDPETGQWSQVPYCLTCPKLDGQ